MASLGHSGYGVYCIEGEMLIVSPAKAVIVPEDTVPYELVALLDSAEEDNEWMDHKINWSLIRYGSLGNDLEEGI